MSSAERAEATQPENDLVDFSNLGPDPLVEEFIQFITNRAAYDLPEGMKEKITNLADQHGTIASQIAAVLLAFGLEALERGDIDQDERKYPNDSRRFKFNLNYHYS